MTSRFDVLLISLGDEVLGAETEDAHARHQHYADSIDHLHMVVWNRHDRPATSVSLLPKLTVYPAGRGGRWAFVRDALRIGEEIVRRHPVRVISTQEPFYTAAVGLRLRSLSRGEARLQIQNHSDFFDNSLWIAERPLWNAALNVFGKWAARRADRLRVVNTTEKQKYLRLGIPADHIDVLPVPVDLAVFERPVDESILASLRARWNIPTDAPVLFWVGRPVPFKDLGTLLKAMAVVCRERPEVRLMFGGDFSRTPQWPALAKELGLAESARFVGPIGRDELPAYYALASLYLHSSMYEGFGRVMLEASAAGKAIVATRTAGATDIVRGGETGLLCPPRDPGALAEATLTLLADPARAQRMGEAGRAWVRQQFDPQRLSQGVAAAWRKCAE